MAAPSTQQDYFSNLPSTVEANTMSGLADELEVQLDEGHENRFCRHPHPSSALSLHSLAGTFDPSKNVTADPTERRTLLDMRILNGKRVTKAGKILDYEGRIMGELSDGELEDCIGAYVDEVGQFYNKRGEHVGFARIVPGEAANEALKEMMEELEKLEDEQRGTTILEDDRRMGRELGSWRPFRG